MGFISNILHHEFVAQGTYERHMFRAIIPERHQTIIEFKVMIGIEIYEIALNQLIGMEY